MHTVPGSNPACCFLFRFVVLRQVHLKSSGQGSGRQKWSYLLFLKCDPNPQICSQTCRAYVAITFSIYIVDGVDSATKFGVDSTVALLRMFVKKWTHLTASTTPREVRPYRVNGQPRERLCSLAYATIAGIIAIHVGRVWHHTVGPMGYWRARYKTHAVSISIAVEYPWHFLLGLFILWSRSTPSTY